MPETTTTTREEISITFDPFGNNNPTDAVDPPAGGHNPPSLTPGGSSSDNPMTTIIDETGKMPTDLSPNMHNTLLTNAANTQQLLLAESAGNVMSANNVVRHIAARDLGEVGAIEGSATEKVLRVGGA